MIDDTRVLSKSVASIFTGVVLFIGVVDAILIVAGATFPPHFNWWAQNFVFVSAFIVNPLLMWRGTKSSFFKVAALVWLLLTMGVMYVFFAEVNGPFTAFWAMLILIVAIYAGWPGFIFSSVYLVVISAAYCIMFAGQLKPDFIGYSGPALMIVTLTITASYFFVRVLMNSHKKAYDLQVTQKSELMQVNRLNTLLNSISDIVVTLNRYGRITSQNAAAQAFFDTNKSLIGTEIDKLLILFDDDGQDVSIHKLISDVKGTSIRDDLSTGKGDDVRHLSIHLSRIHSIYGDTEDYGVVLIIRDITKQKTLEDEKDEFISVTSHELRTPVAIAEGSLSNFLLMQERDMPQDKLTEAAEAAHKQIIYLAQMINDLSTLSRAERGVGDAVEPIDVNELLHNLFTKYSPEAEEKSLRLDLDTEHHLPEITTSRLYLEEILQNFITNAIKYTKKGSVTFGAKRADGNKIEFYVKDTGIGMSKSDLQHIFEKFYRSEDYRTRETSGTGLGLYVVEKLAHKLGTKIEVESRLNVGSTFYFILSPTPVSSQTASVSDVKPVESHDDGEGKESRDESVAGESGTETQAVS